MAAASPSVPTADWGDRCDSGHPAVRKQTDSRLDRDRDVDDGTSKSSAVVSYTRTARHERTTYERSSSSRYVDQCSDSKYRSHVRRSPDREYGRDGDDGDEYYAHSSSKSGSRYNSDQHYYSSSSYRDPHSSSHHSNPHSFRSDHYRDRERQRRSPSESRKRSYRDEEYSRGLDRHSGLDRDDHRVRKVDANSNSYYKSSSSASEKLTSNSHRSSSGRTRAEESRHTHSAAVSPSSRHPVPGSATGTKRSTVVRTFGDWEEHVSSSNKLYYYNRVSGVSQWEKPRHLIQSHTAHLHDPADVRAKSPAAVRQRNHVLVVDVSDDEEDLFDRKRSRRSAVVVKDEVQSKSQSSHVTYQQQNSGHAGHRSSRSHVQPDSHSRSHSLLDRSSSVQSSSSGSSLRNEERRRADDEDRRRTQQRVRSTNFMDSDAAESSRRLKRKTTDLTSERQEPVPRPDHSAPSVNGVIRRTGVTVPDESNGCSNQRKKVLLNSPLNHHPDPMTKKKESESIATSSDHSSNSCRSQCLSPSQVTMDNLEKIIDSLADTPGLPDLRKLSREDALKTIQQVLRIMKEASLGIAARTPVSPTAATHSARSSHPNNGRGRPPVVRTASSHQVVDHEPAINGGAVFLNRQDLTIPSPSSEISGYSSTRSPSDSGVDIAVPSKPSVPSLTATLANFFRDDLIRHVHGWPADQAERQVSAGSGRSLSHPLFAGKQTGGRGPQLGQQGLHTCVC